MKRQRVRRNDQIKPLSLFDSVQHSKPVKRQRKQREKPEEPVKRPLFPYKTKDHFLYKGKLYEEQAVVGGAVKGKSPETDEIVTPTVSEVIYIPKDGYLRIYQFLNNRREYVRGAKTYENAHHLIKLEIDLYLDVLKEIIKHNNT
jgi:hypothetical protein